MLEYHRNVSVERKQKTMNRARTAGPPGSRFRSRKWWPDDSNRKKGTQASCEVSNEQAPSLMLRGGWATVGFERGKQNQTSLP